MKIKIRKAHEKWVESVKVLSMAIASEFPKGTRVSYICGRGRTFGTSSGYVFTTELNVMNDSGRYANVCIFSRDVRVANHE